MNEAKPVVQHRSFLMALQATERLEHRIRGISLLLVILLHLWLFNWLLQRIAEPPSPKPQIIEVTMLTPPKPVPVVQAPPPPPPPPPKAIEKPKPVVKPVVKTPPKPVLPKPVAPKVLAQPQTPVITKEAFTIPAEPKAEPVKAPPIAAAPATPPAQSKKSAENSEGEGPSNSNTVVTGVVPLVRIPPKYPPRAMGRHIEGWVKIEFTITTSGTVENPKVVAAEPPEIFDEAALDAISEWQFKEKMVNGKAIEQRAVQTLQFKLTN